MQWILDSMALTGDLRELVRAGLEVATFLVKVMFFMWVYVWVRWTLPRFRFDQLMDLGWRVMFPLALGNVVVTAVLIYLGWL